MRDGDATAAYLRLMEMAEAKGDWRSLGENARRQLAVNPLIPAPYRGLARASEELGVIDEAVIAYRSLLLLDDTDPAGVHYHLASLLRRVRQAGGRRGARCSSRWSKRPASVRPTSFCSSCSNMTRLKPPQRPPVPGSRGDPSNDTKSSIPGGRPIAAGPRHGRRSRTARRPVSAASARG